MQYTREMYNHGPYSEKDDRSPKVFGEMPVDEYKKAIGFRFREVNVLPANEAILQAELAAQPGSRIELHPRMTAPGILDLVPTVFDPALRAPVFERKDQQRERGFSY
jgi:hypothetical protein